MKKQNIGKIAGLMAAVAIGMGASSSALGALVFSGSGTSWAGNAISASATFEIVGSQLKIVLVNTGPAAINNSDVLMGVYFSWAGGGSVTPDQTDGISTPGLTGSAPSGQTLGGGWAYNPAAGNGATGYGSLGAGTWGNGSTFWSATPNPPPNGGVDGINWGIVSGLATDNHINGSAPQATPSVTFYLDISGTADLANLSVSGFSYGTGSEDYVFVPGTTPVPEPTTMIAGALLLLPFGASTLRILRKNRAA